MTFYHHHAPATVPTLPSLCVDQYMCTCSLGALQTTCKIRFLQVSISMSGISEKTIGYLEKREYLCTVCLLTRQPKSCVFFLSRHRCTLLSLLVVCDCLRQRRAGQVQQHFGGDHRPPAFADSNLQSGGIQVRLCGNSSCEVTPSFMQPVGLFLKYTLHNLGCDNKMRLEPIFLNTTCVVSVIEDFLTDCL